MRKKILKTITTIEVVLAILSGMALDSESYIPMITMFISLAWLLPFTIVNSKGVQYGSGKDL